jgi:hypothetical protein
MEETQHGHEEGRQEALEVGEEAGQEGEERQEEVVLVPRWNATGPSEGAALRVSGQADAVYRLPGSARPRNLKFLATEIVGE